jgi:transcription elongation GreA/GreB family factor
MSKAFVREPDVEPPDRPPEIAVPPPPNPVTADGHRQIRAAIEALDVRLTAEGASVERAERDRMQRERRYWTARLATARITAPPSDAEEIGFGSQVKVAWPGRGEVVFRIVGEDEVDPSRGLIGWRAPVAYALIGNGLGDDVSIVLAGNAIRLKVLTVDNRAMEG